MRWSNRVRLVGRFLRADPVRSAAFVLGLTVAVGLPVAVLAGAAVSRAMVDARLDGAPVVLVGPEDPRSAVLSALLFLPGEATASLPGGAAALVDGSGGGTALPVRTGASVQGLPLVGVGAGWLRAWGLELDAGRPAALPGEVVVGRRAARTLAVAVGDRLQADATGIISLDHAPPPHLEVVGVLAPTSLPEGGAVLTPIETTWMLDGSLHGGTEGAHLHAARSDQPISALVVRPADAAARDRLLAEVDAQEWVVAVQPRRVVAALGAALQGPRRVLVGTASLVVLAMVALLGALGQLVLRARAPQHKLLRELGGPPTLLRSLLLLELSLLLVAASLSTAGLVALARFGASGLLR